VTTEGHTFPSWNCDGLVAACADPPVKSIIGKGSYGVVWLAQSRETGERYALKNLQVKSDAHVDKAMANREFELVDKISALPHANIVSFHWMESFQIDSYNELFILAMEFCPSGDLQAALDKCQRRDSLYVPPTEASLWIGQIFLAVEHVHSKLNLLIRDLKPANVLLSTRQCVKLTDFGFGCAVADMKSRGWTFHMPPCTPGYGAPELLRRQSCSYPVDIYSLGVLVWVMLSGGSRTVSRPAPPSNGVMRDFASFEDDWKLLKKELQDPAQARCDVKRHAHELITSMTQKRPSDRFGVASIRKSKFFVEDVLPLVEPGEGSALRDIGRHEGCLSSS
jgi:serine/threonine protein kinase